MPFGRDVSPAGSEYEFDIAGGLLGDVDDSDSEDEALPTPLTKRPKLSNSKFDTSEIVDELDDGDDDEAFIAAHTAAMNRKTKLVNGKGTKKSGGFQAMGMGTEPTKFYKTKRLNMLQDLTTTFSRP